MNEEFELEGIQVNMQTGDAFSISQLFMASHGAGETFAPKIH